MLAEMLLRIFAVVLLISFLYWLGKTMFGATSMENDSKDTGGKKEETNATTTRSSTTSTSTTSDKKHVIPHQTPLLLNLGKDVLTATAEDVEEGRVVVRCLKRK